jgi:hypothetical protein
MHLYDYFVRLALEILNVAITWIEILSWLRIHITTLKQIHESSLGIPLSRAGPTVIFHKHDWNQLIPERMAARKLEHRHDVITTPIWAVTVRNPIFE